MEKLWTKPRHNAPLGPLTDIGHFLDNYGIENDQKRSRNAWAAAERAERFRPKEPSRPANGPFGRSLIGKCHNCVNKR